MNEYHSFCKGFTKNNREKGNNQRLKFQTKKRRGFRFSRAQMAWKNNHDSDVTGLIKPTAGTISICGFDVKERLYESHAIFRLALLKSRTLSFF